MNIREIEQQLGIPRANVRYYEKEGLLHPERGANNYRVYTDADVAALKKIRLLRQLDMPIETIRAVQAGEVPLVDAVARQEQLLENEAVKLEQSRAVCRSMLADRVTYAALEPAKYEQVRPALPGRAAPEPPAPKRPPVEGAEWAFSPWQRFWARSFDMSLVDAVVTIVLALVFHVSVVSAGSGLNVLITVLTWALTLAVEPLLLSTWGTTPGKWLLGLELRDSDGRKLSYSEGLERTWGVLGKGYGYCLPIYNLYRQYKSYRQCRENEPLEYDRFGGFQYYSISHRRWGVRAVVSVVLSGALAIPMVLAAYQVLLPPNRGDITKAELFENISKVAEQMDYYLWLDDEGYELADFTGTVSTNGGPEVQYVYGEPVSDKPVYTMETDGDGYVTAVVLEASDSFSGMENDVNTMGNAASWLPISRAELMIRALAGTSGSGIELALSPLLKDLNSVAGWDGSSVSAGGFTQTITLETEGYYSTGFSGLMMPEEDAESGWYRFTVRVEKEQ